MLIGGMFLIYRENSVYLHCRLKFSLYLNDKVTSHVLLISVKVLSCCMRSPLSFLEMLLEYSSAIDQKLMRVLVSSSDWVCLTSFPDVNMKIGTVTDDGRFELCCLIDGASVQLPTGCNQNPKHLDGSSV